MLEEQEKVRFGLYVADFNSLELKKGQETVPLQNLPFRILTLLLREPGRVVSREEIRSELWPADTFVDFERGISTAVSKLREALGDSATNPRFIATVGRRGYRFIAPVAPVSQPALVPMAASTAASAAPATAEPKAEAPVQARISLRRRAVFLGVAVLSAALALLAFDWLAERGQPHVTRMTQLTTSGRIEPAGGLFSDGVRLFFIERIGSRWNLMQTSTAGGEAVPVPVPFPNAFIMAISPDKTEMLLSSRGAYLEKRPIWIVPIQGGTPQRVGDVTVDAAQWFPDGQRLLCSNNQEIFSIQRDGSQRRHIATTDGIAARFSWRPDGSVFRFTLWKDRYGITIWEASADGSNLHRVSPDWSEMPDDCCGTWSPDGKSYVFRSRQNGQHDLWLWRSPGGWPWPAKPFFTRLTNGPTSFSEPLFSPDGRKVFATGLLGQGYLAHYDVEQQQVSRMQAPAEAIDVAFSHDKQWVAYIAAPEQTLWRSRADGSAKLALTTLPLNAIQPRWSKDDRQLLFMGATHKDQHTAYIVNADGSGLHQVIENDTVYRGTADWSPDQQSITLGELPSEQSAGHGIIVVNLADHSTQEIPGSQGLSYPTWSPDGDYLAAVSFDLKRVMVLNTHTHEWKQLAGINVYYRLTWEADGKHALLQDYRTPTQVVYRIDVTTGQSQPAADCSRFLHEGATWCGFQGRAPDGALMFFVTSSWANLYAFDVDVH
jgi:Tol biopolymer transport system component/DNA-binding winged helix-turn-helix (wHTH) protein